MFPFPLFRHKEGTSDCVSSRIDPIDPSRPATRNPAHVMMGDKYPISVRVEYLFEECTVGFGKLRHAT